MDNRSHKKNLKRRVNPSTSNSVSKIVTAISKKKRRIHSPSKRKTIPKFTFEKNLIRSGVSFIGSRLKDVYALIPGFTKNTNNSSSNNNITQKSSEKLTKKSSEKLTKKSSKKLSKKREKLSRKISKIRTKKIFKRLIFSPITTKNGIPIHKDGFEKGTTKWEMAYIVNFNKPAKKRTDNIWIIQNITLKLNIKSNPNKFTIKDVKKNINGQWDPLVFTKNNKNINENDIAGGLYYSFYTELFMYNKIPNKTDKSGYKDMFPVNPWIFSSSKKEINHKGELDYSVKGEIFQVPATTIESYNLDKFNPAGELKAKSGHIDKSLALGDTRTRCVEYNIVDNHIKKIKLMGSDKKWVSFNDSDQINSGNIPTIEPLDLVY